MVLLHRLTLVLSIALLSACNSGDGEGALFNNQEFVEVEGNEEEGSLIKPLTGLGLAVTIEGLNEGASLTLIELGSNQTLELSSNESRFFFEGFSDETSYDVNVMTQPAGQNCTVSNDTGTFSGADVMNAKVICLGSSGYNLQLVGFQSSQPSLVIGGIRVEDISSGNPVLGLTISDFNVKENGQAIGSEASLSAERIQEGRINLSTVLILDVSRSIDTTEMKNIKTAAKAALYSEDASGVKTSKLFSAKQKVAIYTFAGTVEELVGFTADLGELETAIDSIPDNFLDRGASTNLLGAVEEALALWEVKIDLSTLDHGYAILLTDGEHTSDSRTPADIVDGFTNEYGVRKSIYALAVGDGVSIENLTELTGDSDRVYQVGSFDTAELTTVLSKISSEALAQIKGLYRVYYATPKRADINDVSFEVNGNSCSNCIDTVGSQFDATNFMDTEPALYALLSGGIEQEIGKNLLAAGDFLVVEASLRWINITPSIMPTIESLDGADPVVTQLSNNSWSYQFPAEFNSAVLKYTEASTGFIVNVSLTRTPAGLVAVSDSVLSAVPVK